MTTCSVPSLPRYFVQMVRARRCRTYSVSRIGSLVRARIIAQRFQDRAELPDGHSLAEQQSAGSAALRLSFITPGINSSTTAGEVCFSSLRGVWWRRG